MPRKDGLDEASLLLSESLRNSIAKAVALELLTLVATMWNDAHCADCFSKGIETLRAKILHDQILIRYLPEDSNEID